MSGRVQSRTPNSVSFRLAKFFLALGLLAVIGFAAAPATHAIQPPTPPKGTEKTGEKGTEKGPDIDPDSPLPPPSTAKQQLAARIPVPNPDRAIFLGRKDTRGLFVLGTGVVDYEEIASEKKNSDEYQAWHEVVSHARQFSQADLEEFAHRELTWDDLVGIGPPQPRVYRLRLVRLEGTLAKVRRLAATKSLQDEGLKEIFEGQLIPLDGPPTETVSLVFMELPPALASVAQGPLNQWVEVNAPALGTGFFFKVKQDPPGTDKVPVLIGKSVTLLKGQTDALTSVNPGSDPNPVAIDPTLQVYKGIKDDARPAKGDDNWQEAVSWNRVLLHARRFAAEDLEKYARTDLKFADLFDPVRADYKLQLVRFEGRLLMVRKMEPSHKLRAAGVNEAYEGWLVPQDEPRGNPLCIVFTDLPEGLELGRVNRWVSFAGYSFKLIRYESGERDKDDPAKNVIKRAPLLLGRTVLFQRDPDAASTAVSWTTFMWALAATIFVLVGIGGGLTWWFRKGDSRAKEEINAHRTKNPFESTGN